MIINKTTTKKDLEVLEELTEKGINFIIEKTELEKIEKLNSVKYHDKKIVLDDTVILDIDSFIGQQPQEFLFNCIGVKLTYKQIGVNIIKKLNQIDLKDRKNYISSINQYKKGDLESLKKSRNQILKNLEDYKNLEEKTYNNYLKNLMAISEAIGSKK